MRISKTTEKVTFAIIGAGNRSGCYLKALEKHFPNQFKVIAVADPNIEIQKEYQSKYEIEDDMVFCSYQDFLKINKRIADVAIIATTDSMHYEPAIALIEKGYDLILEKPIAMTLEETVAIGECAKKHKDQLVAVCHVLRFAPFFRYIKEIIDSKVLGEIIDIQHNENVGYFHYVHSYVRGNWRNTDVSAPFIVAKCCHDMDILLYLLGDKHCVSLSSVGDLSFFNSDHYDKQKMASRCIDCSIQKECPFDCVRIYDTPLVDWFHFDCSTPEKTKESFQDSPYGRCVFQCDNNVCDHQTVSLKFDKGVTATFNASAFTKYTSRTIKIMCEYGEIRGNEHSKIIEVQRWDSDEIKTIRLTDEETSGNHAGGDEGFIKYFMDAYINEKDFSSSIALSIESHVMAYAAEMSRLKDGEMKNIPSLWVELTKK